MAKTNKSENIPQKAVKVNYEIKKIEVDEFIFNLNLMIKNCKKLGLGHSV